MKGNILKECAGGFGYPVVRFYIANVILAFRHIHAMNIAYRDLKPENLLIDVAGYLKVIDFGFAKKFPFLKNGVVQEKTYTLCTPEYLAPEIIMSKGYDKGVDYWALGTSYTSSTYLALHSVPILQTKFSKISSVVLSAFTLRRGWTNRS